MESHLQLRVEEASSAATPSTSERKKPQENVSPWTTFRGHPKIMLSHVFTPCAAILRRPPDPRHVGGRHAVQRLTAIRAVLYKVGVYSRLALPPNPVANSLHSLLPLFGVYLWIDRLVYDTVKTVVYQMNSIFCTRSTFHNERYVLRSILYNRSLSVHLTSDPSPPPARVSTGDNPATAAPLPLAPLEVLTFVSSSNP